MTDQEKNKEIEEQEAKADWQRNHEQREFEREAIRSRHNAIREYIDVQYRHPKPYSSMWDDKKNVAVYTRVSTMNLNQTSSIENQELYYKDKVKKNENWNLTEIYSDEGKSGTSTKKRDAFKKMMKDAKEGKFNLILCASVSRFARNVSDCIDYVAELKLMNPKKPIGVFFETENIFTLNPDAEQTLSFHALLADWESGNKSRRMILSYDQRILTNQFPVSDLLGFRHTKDGDLIVEPEEAKTVRFIYLAYINGYSAKEIAVVLSEKKRPTLKGRTDWNAGMVRKIMENERRWGDLEARKTVVLDYKKKKIAKNTNIREGAFVPNHHEAIVSRDIAEVAKIITKSTSHHSGLPDNIVIANGALKGFVSICPTWGGITDEHLMAVSMSVYEEEEVEELEREARVKSGEEKSRMLSMSLHDYQVPNGAFFITDSQPAIVLQKRGITFNRACKKRLGECEYVELLYHPVLQTIVLRQSSADNPNSVAWGTGRKDMTAHAFSEAVYERMDWNPKFRFKFRGVQRTRGGVGILLFDLSEPQVLVGKFKSRTQTTDESHYIPINKEDGEKELKLEPDTAYVAYPAELSGKAVGISYALKRRIRRIENEINENDIRERGVLLSNSMFGDVPEKAQMLEELEELLENM
jgi:site-specific DNA recombinase